jgi:hypothetical protein
MTTIWIGMRAQDAAVLFERLAQKARAVRGIDGALEVRVDAESNENAGRVELVFNNDDMERDEMAARTIVDMDP